jgi:hypothetical protein
MKKMKKSQSGKPDGYTRIHKKAYWCTAAGQILPLKDMDSRHLFNSIRMVFNNIAPEELQIPGGGRYPDIKDWPKETKYETIRDMITELETREESEMSEFFTQLTKEEWKWIQGIKVYNEMKII